MRLRLGNSQVTKLHRALAVAGTKEIGGQLFGEQLAPSDFRVTELTVQRRRGSFARFVVDLLQAARDAVRFFDSTRHQYVRYNYIGEWHSHPSFDVRPSLIDIETMRQVVLTEEFRGNFAALVIVRLDQESIAAGGRLFDPRGFEIPLEVELERE